ncbi:MAG: transposase, partial [Acidobacteria bacterium]|nr:transposase [Acidobacteriota bacterium]
MRRVILPAVEFMARFLQHVLPPGCTKVRYYGLW